MMGVIFYSYGCHPRDGLLHEIFELFDRLPEKLCLQFDRQTGNIKILQIHDAKFANIIKGATTQTTLSATTDDFSGEICQRKGDGAKRRVHKHQISDFLLIAGHAHSPARRRARA
jgi:hypothetical protein